MTQQATVTIGEDGKVWTCTVARSPQDLASGLSNIESMLPSVGILFVMPSEQIVSVNMELMLFPLDILFIDSDLKVIEIAANVEPLSSFASSLSCKYFLEVNAGETADIVVGDDVTIVYGELSAPSTPNDVMSTILPALVIIGMVGAVGKTIN